MIHRNTQIIAVSALIFFMLSVSATTLFVKVVDDKKEAYAAAILLESEMKERERSLNDVMQRLEETKVERESLHTRILKEEDFIDFLAMVELLGEEQGVELTTNSLSEEGVNNDFEILIMNVKVAGPYNAVLHTLQIFEHMPYQSSLQNIVMQSNDGALWEMQFEFRVAKYRN